ncbi:hypothetical protein BMF94_1958 [Rhodotorula taiwanensis]|uniref:SnoaL-like domain-containing protein n=1 Tax=Rhodotorula taiwanensis TaxID=741276 RepID=A0A2S5BDY1_9BASI|nr:hypothetical protein BMF94_1958 [Rhodotorula taiwanensis]
MTTEEHTHYPGRPHPCDDAHPRLTATLVRFRDAMNDPACTPSTLRPFFTDDKPVCIEHGPSDVEELPFLGKPYEGERAILEYFNLIGTVLKGRGSRFHEDDLVVKVLEKNHVHTARAIWTGEATWSVAKTGKEWQEHVVWAFDWLREGREWKIQKWEVWADPLSAYFATKP